MSALVIHLKEAVASLHRKKELEISKYDHAIKVIQDLIAAEEEESEENESEDEPQLFVSVTGAVRAVFDQNPILEFKPSDIRSHINALIQKGELIVDKNQSLSKLIYSALHVLTKKGELSRRPSDDGKSYYYRRS